MVDDGNDGYSLRVNFARAHTQFLCADHDIRSSLLFLLFSLSIEHNGPLIIGNTTKEFQYEIKHKNWLGLAIQ